MSVPSAPQNATFSHITARVPADDYERLCDLAVANDRTPSAELRRAIRFYLEAAA